MARPGGSAYGAIAEDLRRAMNSREYATGSQLPTEATLSTVYGVSRQTIRRAFQDLVSEGLVHRVPGRGTFVAGEDDTYIRQFGSIEDLMALSVDTTMELIAPLSEHDDAIKAARLGLPTARVCSVRLVRRHESVPFCVTEVWLPPDIAALIAESPEMRGAGTGRSTILGLIDARLGDPVREADQCITVGPATLDQAHALRVTHGSPLLQIERTYFDSARRPIEYAQSGFRPDCYSYRVKLRRTAA